MHDSTVDIYYPVNQCSSSSDVCPDDGKLLKAVSVSKDNGVTEEILLEELTVFQVGVVSPPVTANGLGGYFLGSNVIFAEKC